MTDFTNVTRIQLQTDLGRYEFWADTWEPEIKDDGQSLHLRGRGTGKYAKTQRDIAAAEVADATPAGEEDAE